VWAYPSSGAPPIFVGPATIGLNRLDVEAAFFYVAAGFQISVGALPSGAYTLVFYAHNQRAAVFDDAQAVAVTVAAMPVTIGIDTPSANAIVRSPFVIGGFAIDPSGPSGTGIDAVQVWAYPATGAPPVFAGTAFYGNTRTDVGATYGSRFTQSGFTVSSALPPGGYTLAIFARSISNGQFTAKTVPVTVMASDPRMNVDVPAPGPVAQSFVVSGWALDLATGTGTGVDAVHVWAFPASGGAPTFLGAAGFGPRPDVGTVFGSQFTVSGFGLGSAVLPSGTYDLQVFAHSTVTGTFNDVRVIRVIVP
jgi:hypothetical protein